jgi:hypothetical protein
MQLLRNSRVVPLPRMAARGALTGPVGTDVPATEDAVRSVMTAQSITITLVTTGTTAISGSRMVLPVPGLGRMNLPNPHR